MGTLLSLSPSSVHVQYIIHGCGAAAHGHADALHWLLFQGCPWEWGACSEAAAAGQLEVLKLLLAQDSDVEALLRNEKTRYSWPSTQSLSKRPCDFGVFVAASAHGQLKVLEYLHQRSIPPLRMSLAMRAAAFG